MRAIADPRFQSYHRQMASLEQQAAVNQSTHLEQSTDGDEAPADAHELTWNTPLPELDRTRIATLFRAQKTLEDVVRWGLAQRPVQLVERVVIQDEYTHDVVVRDVSGAYLVYDCT